MQNGRFYSHLNTAEKLIAQYQGKMPLHHFLRAYFKENSKYGSKDRKQISRLCYAYFRTGNTLKDHPIKEKILSSLLLCIEEPDPVLSALKPEWNEEVGNNTSGKIAFLASEGLKIDLTHVFPLFSHLSNMIDESERFVLSHTVQPRLFLRIRPGKEDAVETALRKAAIPFNIFDHTIELANGTDISKVLQTDRDVVVQDLSSQQTGRAIAKALELIGPAARVWDCCAASGGKSLMAIDLDPSIELSVSDVRPSILENLGERFKKAGVKKYHSFQADLTTQTRTGLYDIVIADVPCSGSGTWGRTPEELCFFSSDKLDRYTGMQLAIVNNVSRNLRPGGILLYFTCSVYRDENEGMVAQIADQTKLELVSMELIGGWETRADSMFMAIFRLPKV